MPGPECRAASPGDCADSGDFGARHYVRTVLLALPGVGAQDGGCVGPLGSPATLGIEIEANTPQSLLGRVLRRGVLLLRLPGCRGRVWVGGRTRIWRLGNGSVTGSEESGARKLGQLRAGGVRTRAGVQGVQPFSDLIPSLPPGAHAESSLMARNTPPPPRSSAQLFRTGLLKRGRSDRRCVQALLATRPILPVCLPLPDL